MAFDKKLSRRNFIKIIAAGGTTIVFGSIFGGFSHLLPTNKNGSTSSSTSSVGGVQMAAAQSAPGTFVLGPSTAFIAMHVAHLPNGRIMYAAGSGFSATHENGPFQWGIFNPDTESMTNHTVNEDLFCMGQAVLTTGRVLCAGGTLRYDTVDPDGLWKGLPSAFEYDPGSDSLVKVQSMLHGRWYPYCITLDSGRVVTIGGYDEWGCFNRLCEIYDPDSKSWSVKYDPNSSLTYAVGACNPTAPAGLPTYGGSGQGVTPPIALYPRAIYMPSGLVAIAGQSRSTRTLNPETGRWVFAGNLAVGRSYGNMALLPLNNDASEAGQLLVWGGSNTSGDTTTTVVELLTPNSGTNNTTFSFQQIAPCNIGRRHAPAVYLPDGKLVTFGGTVFQNRLSDAPHNAEIFDPVARNWTVVGGMTVPKLYHSAATLLFDGRVWLTGNSISKSNWELRSEYYVPAYYNATRPTISSDPAVGNYGETINISTPNAADIEKVSLIRLSSFTHGFDSELRFIWLQIQSKGSNSVTVSAPLNARIAPPGYYMIHVLNSAGVPSRARIIKLPGTASPPPPPGEFTTIYSQPGTNSYIVLNSGGFHRAGEVTRAASTLIGNSVKRVSVILKRAGNPTGTVFVRFRRGTNDTVATTFGQIDATTLTTTDQTFTVESTTSQTFATNDRILVEYDAPAGQPSTDQVHVKRHAYATSADSFDGVNTRQTHKLASSTGYNSYDNADLAGVWYRSG